MWIGTADQIENQTDPKTAFCFIRHGQTLSNEQHRYLGIRDEALSEAGRIGLQELKLRVEKRQSDRDILLFSGPMGRCVETARILFPDRQPILIPEWTEINFGVFEGKNYEELKEDRAYQEWLDSGGTLPFPGGESREAFIFRSMKGYERMRRYLPDGCEGMSREAEKTAAQTVKKPLQVIAVVHGGTIMAVCSSLFGGDYFDYQIPCGGEYSCII